MCGSGHFVGLALVVGSVPKAFRSVPKVKLTVKMAVSNSAVITELSSKGELSKSNAGDRSVKVARLTSIKVFTVSKKVPLNCADGAGVGLFEVDVAELVSGVGDEDGTESILNVLEICPCPKIAVR